LQPADSFKLKLAELPFDSATVKQDMIDSIEIYLDNTVYENIGMIKFKRLQKKVVANLPQI